MCGIAGCYNVQDAARITRSGLHFLQHRGQEHVGLVSSDGSLFYPERAAFREEGLALVAVTEQVLSTMPGYMAIGHVRYATQGASELKNVQPHRADTKDGLLFFCSNGDIVNCEEIRRYLKPRGHVFYSDNDGEAIAKLLASCYQDCGEWVSAIRKAKDMLNGSYSGLLMIRDKIFLVRDRLENRPFSYAVADDGAVFFASETAALNSMTRSHRGFNGNDYDRREVRGNEIVELSGGSVLSHLDEPATTKRAHCVFEEIYFARPNSSVFGLRTKTFKRRLAKRLVEEARPMGDLISPVPDSGNEYAFEIAWLTGIRLDNILYRSHYGRTFIAPTQKMRDFGVLHKFDTDPESIAGKEIILVDDSIVRGTTMRKLVEMIRASHPKRITLLIACPLIMHPCYYGIDMKKNLIAARLEGNIEAIKEAIGLKEHDVLHFLSLEGLKSCVDDPQNWCFACLSGEYPTDVREFVPLRS